MAIRDKIINKMTGRKIETVPMTLEQITELLKKHYISQAASDEDYTAIIKTVKGSMIGDKNLTSKDGRYEIRCSTGRNVGLFNLKQHNLLWIHDIETDKYYEYCAWSFGKLKKAAKVAVASAKAGI